MLVIDASALVDVLTVDPTDIPELAQRVHDVEWMSAPDLLDCELQNVLRKLVIRGDIDDQLAGESRRALRDLRLSRHPMTDALSDRVWQLRHNMSAYDAAYVALAEELETPLVTTDHRLVEAATKLTKITIESY
jgi:predicted nucleic acid-binding protein